MCRSGYFWRDRRRRHGHGNVSCGHPLAAWRGLLRRARRSAELRLSAAAVLGEVIDEAVHRGEVRRVADEAALLLTCHEIGVTQLLQMKRERRRRDPQGICDRPDRDAGG